MRGFSRLGEKKIDRELKCNKFRAPSTPDLSRLNVWAETKRKITKKVPKPPLKRTFKGST